MICRVGLALAACLALAAPAAAAPRYDLGLSAGDVTLSVPPEQLVAGAEVRVYVAIHNYGQVDGLAHAVLYSGDQVIGQSDAVMVRPGGTGTAWVDWTAEAGPWPLRVQLLGFDGRDEVSSNNSATVEGLVVDVDTDGDGLPNGTDRDDDNDGLSDELEDQAGTDPLKADTDGDGTADRFDVAPTDPDESGVRPDATEDGGRNIFEPPPERSTATLPVPDVPVVSGFTDQSASATPAAGSPRSAYAPPLAPAAGTSGSVSSWAVGDWLPYALILLGGIGFATVSFRRRRAVPPAMPVQPTPAPRPSAARAVTVKVVAVPAKPRRRAAPAKRVRSVRPSQGGT